MGAHAETVSNAVELADAFTRAKASALTTVIVMQVDPYDGWTSEGHAWWEIGTPEISETRSVTAAHKDVEATRTKRQRKGI